jgi:hypothetical protein
MEPGYSPCVCVTSVQFLRAIDFKTHAVSIGVPEMQRKLYNDLRVYKSKTGRLRIKQIKSDTNHANGVGITIVAPLPFAAPVGTLCV